MALIKLIALAAVALPAAPLVPRARRRAPLLRRASTQQGTLPPEESAPPDWEAMYLAGGDTSRESAPPQRPGPVIRGVSASPAAAAREGFDACVDALQQLNIDARIEETLGDDDGWCRVGVDFQNDILEAHRRGMRCVFIKEKNEDVETFTSSATPPAEAVTCPSISLVAFNGRLAEQSFERQVLPDLPARLARIDRVRLPSTSPAHAAMSFERKRAAWAGALTPVVDRADRAAP